MDKGRFAGLGAVTAVATMFGGALAFAVGGIGCGSDDSVVSDDAGELAPICPDGSCNDDANTGTYEPVGDGTSFTQAVGPGGGTLVFEGITLAIPAGALKADTSVVITSSPEAAPDGVQNLSPVYALAPAGLSFAIPASVSIQYEVGGANPVVVTATNANASGFTGVTTTTAANVATGNLSRMSSVFVANAATLGSIPASSDGGTAVVTTDASADAGPSDAATD